MKWLAILCFVFYFTFVIANNHGCNNQPCGVGKICHTKGDSCCCIEINKCNSVELIQEVKNIWEVDGKHYTQYDVSVINKDFEADITQIYIGTDSLLTLKDYSSFWNVNRLENGELILPGYQLSINKNSTYTFGFIICGNAKPGLAILSVIFAK